MLANGFNVVVDAFWGSSGKGKVSAFIARHGRASVVSSCNAPNAGHTTESDGKRVVWKSLPSASCEPSVETVLIGPGSVLDVARFNEERSRPRAKVAVHPRCPILTDIHKAREGGLKKIASTRQGAGAALADKIMRAAEMYAGEDVVEPDKWRELIKSAAQTRWLHEVAQGFALSIDHGSHYPECTSRNCTTATAIDQMGVAPRVLREVFLVLRTYPIRVGNDGDDSHSGGWYPDSAETNWKLVAQTAGMTTEQYDELVVREHTTVTKRLRRVSTFSYMGAKIAADICGATQLVVNFAQYLDMSIAGVRDRSALLDSSRVRGFLESIEDHIGLPVTLVGTGADTDDMVVLT